MNFSLQVNSQRGTTVNRLFEDPKSRNPSKEFAFTVSCLGAEYRLDIPASELEELLHAARSVTISPAGGCGMGLDGKSYELTIDTGFAHATYRWWMSPEEGWRPLEKIAGMLLQLAFKVSGQYQP